MNFPDFCSLSCSSKSFLPIHNDIWYVYCKKGGYFLPNLYKYNGFIVAYCSKLKHKEPYS